MNENRKLRFEYTEKNRITDIVIILENIWYIHNINAIARTVEAAGLKKIYITGTSQPEIPSHRHIDFGCMKYLDVKHFDTLEEIITELKNEGYKIYATNISTDSKKIWETDFSDKIAVIMGNEKDGISEEAADLSDYQIKIPTHGLSRSFNVSVSTGIVLYEILRQKFKKGEYDFPFCAAYELFPGGR